MDKNVVSVPENRLSLMRMRRRGYTLKETMFLRVREIGPSRNDAVTEVWSMSVAGLR